VITTDELVDKIKAEAPTVRLQAGQFGIDTTRFVVEGDVGLDESALPAYAAWRIEIATALLADPDAEKQGLLGVERDGRTLRWRPGIKLTYAVWRKSFASDAEYQKVVDGMAAATAAWQSVCGIEFEHVPAKDTDGDLKFGDVSFPVMRQHGGGNTVAMAFFPDEPKDQRLMWVFDAYYRPGSSYDPVGVLRHELGHVLGFRHEHIRPEAPDVFAAESLAHTVELTKYDPKSVMHYVAEGVGDPQLRLTEADRTGARLVYGRPYTDFSFAD
jgi:hypothetical protein